MRIFDIILSGMALALLSPLLVFVVLILRVTGEGEVFYKQLRVGLDGKPFGLLKFATMLKDSEAIGTGTVTVKDDPRVLPVGRVLRKSKMNELPQLINVLRGEMSLIGPRPQTKRCFDVFDDVSKIRIMQMKPGLSGIGPAVFRDEESLIQASGIDPIEFYDTVLGPYKGRVEAWYSENYNIRTYLKLILLTVWVIFVPNSRLTWKVFPSLPRPCGQLEQILKYQV